MQSYWTRILNQRLSRRRAIAAGSAGAAAAAFLAACGEDDTNSSGTGSEPSGLLHRPADETKQAKHGGTYVTTQNNAFAIAPDPHRIGAHGGLAARAYSQL